MATAAAKLRRNVPKSMNRRLKNYMNLFKIMCDDMIMGLWLTLGVLRLEWRWYNTYKIMRRNIGFPATYLLVIAIKESANKNSNLQT